MTLKEASKEALKILKQVMEEKLNSTNVEVNTLRMFTVLISPTHHWDEYSFKNVLIHYC